MGRRTLLLLASLLLAALGTVLVFLYVQSADERATDKQDSVRVLFATKRIDPGTSGKQAIDSLAIVAKTIPRSLSVPNAVSDLKDIQSLTVVSTIFPGEQVLISNFGAEAVGATIPITKGKLAVAVQLSDPARVAGLLSVNSHVTIFASAAGEGGQTTNILLSNVKVLAIGSQSTVTRRTTGSGGSTQTEQIPATIVTVELTPQEAKKVVYATSNGELYFGLIGANDTIPPGGAGVNGSNLFGAGSGS